MRVVFSHFYNEEYLLPWWLRHHRRLFDHGVLIDYNSTDESAKICRDIVPDWEIHQTQNSSFDAILCDHEMMYHERRFSENWKIVLNTTEFLLAERLETVENFVNERNGIAAILSGAIMADRDVCSEPIVDDPLVEQKNWGIWEADVNFLTLRMTGHERPTRSRIYHRYPIGAYLPGRHASSLPGQVRVPAQLASIRWYGFSPWTEKFIQRKLQMATQLSPLDRFHKHGIQHLLDRNGMEVRKNVFVEMGYPVNLRPPKQRAVNRVREQMKRTLGSEKSALLTLSIERLTNLFRN